MSADDIWPHGSPRVRLNQTWMNTFPIIISLHYFFVIWYSVLVMECFIYCIIFFSIQCIYRIYLLILASIYLLYIICNLMHTFLISLFLYRDLRCILRAHTLEHKMFMSSPRQTECCWKLLNRLYSIHHKSLNSFSVTRHMYYVYIFIHIIS